MSWTDFAAGCIGGGASVFVGHPFDTIKVKLQTVNSLSLGQCIRNTYHHEKLRGFFKGMLFPVVTSGMVNSIYFGVYGGSCQLLGELNYDKIRKDCPPKYWPVFVAALLAGVAQVAVIVPIDLVKVKLQAQTLETGAVTSSRVAYRGSIDCAKQIWMANGIRGLYQGTGVQFVRDVPAYGLYMIVYEFMLYKLSKTNSSDITNCFIAGGLAGTLSWASIIPLDVAKSRIQAHDIRSGGQHAGLLRHLVAMYREGGVPIFFRGISLVTLRAFPVNGVQLTLYSLALTFLNKYNHGTIEQSL